MPEITIKINSNADEVKEELKELKEELQEIDSLLHSINNKNFIFNQTINVKSAVKCSKGIMEALDDLTHALHKHR